MGQRKRGMESMELGSFYKGKKVFVTGHTGFKGAWLCWSLLRMGAHVTGFSLPPEDIRGNLYKQTGLADHITSVEGDLADQKLLQESLIRSGAEIVFHLAAQPIVLSSYDDPVETYATNVMGTVHMLEAIRQVNHVKAAVIVTTDKCYENKEWEWPYRETDALGGHDPYSSSKAMAEIATQAYYRSFFKDCKIGIATARAGNVIGGGDFAPYRIIPDIVEAIQKNAPVVLRNPHSIRPWQHVLDALYGYMLLGIKLSENPEKHSTAFNFSPDSTPSRYTVETITGIFIEKLKKGRYEIDETTRKGHEATYLRLDSSRAHAVLGWKPQYLTKEAIEVTANWFVDYIAGKNLLEATRAQIDAYFNALENG